VYFSHFGRENNWTYSIVRAESRMAAIVGALISNVGGFLLVNSGQ
jgi:hypothetical protein